MDKSTGREIFTHDFVPKSFGPRVFSKGMVERQRNNAEATFLPNKDSVEGANLSIPSFATLWWCTMCVQLWKTSCLNVVVLFALRFPCGLTR